MKIDDRVQVYGGLLGANYMPNKGKVIGVKGSLLEIRFDDGTELMAHRKQCRRLITKKRRRVWVDVTHGVESDFWTMAWGSESAALKAKAVFSEFIEVKRVKP